MSIQIHPSHQSRMRSKIATAQALQAVGADRMLGMLGRLFGSSLTIFAYHRVVDIGNEAAFNSDLELVSASCAEFEAQMSFVKENFKPITFAHLLACQDAGEPPPNGSAIVTFDDGFRDNYTYAFPILKKLEVPATIFLTTGYIDRQEPFWFEYLSNILLTTKRSLNLQKGLVLSETACCEERRHVLDQMLRHLKRVPNEERLSFISNLVQQAGFGREQAYPEDRLPLMWDHVREMSAGGIEFGSHTVNHPVLSQMDDVSVRSELFDSKRRIEEIVGKPVQVLSYPVGGSEAFDLRIRKIAMEAGYRLGVGYASGGNQLGRCDTFALRRIRVERYVPISLFRAMSVLPGIFAR
jgi:peptidoglycan/xylan/chitin deacetylase (PgdA/CDA1 family)